jgi:bisphosphoglycerate-independent phosphoglycerate mutase (AlkP superfamily)
MDVNQFWDRTQKTYEVLTTPSKTLSIDEVLNQNYKLNLSD